MQRDKWGTERESGCRDRRELKKEGQERGRGKERERVKVLPYWPNKHQQHCRMLANTDSTCSAARN